MKNLGAALLLFACGALFALPGASAPASKIMRCTDESGHPIIADPSDKRCFKPPKTPDEIAQDEDRFQKALQAYQSCKAEERSDQTLLGRYPTRERHDAARRQALAEIDAALKRSEVRLADLLKEQKHLRDEAEFYPKGDLPAKLKRDIDSNNALIEAQKAAIASQKESAAQKNAFYDEELARLKKLWSPPPGGRRACVYPQR